MNKTALLAHLKRRVRDAGSQTAVARELNVSNPYLCDILKGRRAISENIAHALGFEIHYRPIPRPPKA